MLHRKSFNLLRKKSTTTDDKSIKRVTSEGGTPDQGGAIKSGSFVSARRTSKHQVADLQAFAEMQRNRRKSRSKDSGSAKIGLGSIGRAVGRRRNRNSAQATGSPLLNNERIGLGSLGSYTVRRAPSLTPTKGPKPNGVVVTKLRKVEISKGINSYKLVNILEPKKDETKEENSTLKHEDEEDEKTKLEHQKKRLKVQNEIISSEEIYVNSLDVLIKCYMRPLQDKLFGLSDDDHKTLFSNIKEIHGLHALLFKELKSQPQSQVPKTLLEKADLLKMYTMYLNNYETAMATLNKHSKNSKLQNFLVQQRQSKECNGLDILAYLILPVQRIPRYELLLRELKTCTPPGNAGFDDLIKAFNKIKETANYVNQSKRNLEDRTRLQYLKIKMGNNSDFDLVKDGRNIIWEGKIVMLTKGIIFKDNKLTKKDRHLFICSDCIFWASEKLNYKGGLLFSDGAIDIIDVKNEDTAKFKAFKLSVGDGDDFVYYFLAKTRVEREKLILHILKSVNQWIRSI